MATSPDIQLSLNEQKNIRIMFATKTEKRLVSRTQIILMAAENKINVEVAKGLKTSVITVGKW